MPGMPDDVLSLQELLCALKHPCVMLSQDDLHGIGAEGKVKSDGPEGNHHDDQIRGTQAQAKLR